MCAAFVHPVEDPNASNSQALGVLGGSNLAGSVPAALHPPLEVRFDVHASVGGNEKVETSRSHDDTVRSAHGSDLQPECALENVITKKEIDEATRISQKLGEIEDNMKDPALTFLVEEDICPTCLDGYDTENPKITTACKHHFHLGCILEWAERKPTCPVCDKEMVFNESL